MRGVDAYNQLEYILDLSSEDRMGETKFINTTFINSVQILIKKTIDVSSVALKVDMNKRLKKGG